MYSVVICEDWCTVVPDSWLVRKCKSFWWPRKNATAVTKKAAKPNKTWALMEWKRVLGSFDTYEEARIVEGKASNVSTNDDDAFLEIIASQGNEQLPKKRPLKLPQKLEESYSDNESDGEGPESPPSKKAALGALRLSCEYKTKTQNPTPKRKPAALENGTDEIPLANEVQGDPNDVVVFNLSGSNAEEASFSIGGNWEDVPSTSYSQHYVSADPDATDRAHTNSFGTNPTQETNEPSGGSKDVDAKWKRFPTITEVISTSLPLQLVTANPMDEHHHEKHDGEHRNCCNACRMQNQNMLEVMQMILRNQQELLMRHREGPAPVGQPEPPQSRILPRKPIEQLARLQEFNLKLQQCSASRTSYKREVQCIGGKDAAQHTRLALAVLISNNLSLKLTWTVIGESTEARNMVFMKLLIEAVLQSVHPEEAKTKLYIVEAVAKDWLQRGGDRVRRDKNKTN